MDYLASLAYNKIAKNILMLVMIKIREIPKEEKEYSRNWVIVAVNRF